MVERRQGSELDASVTVMTHRIVENFFVRFNAMDRSVSELLIVSPILGTLEGTGLTLEQLSRILRVRRIATYVITRSPEDEMTRGAQGHRPALATLGDVDFLEVRYNDSLHAKIYICLSNEREKSFALLGSANMTHTSIARNIEVGVMVRYFSSGRAIIDELEGWVKNKLRLHQNSTLHKAITRRA